MNNKHIPTRTCVGCRKKADKSSLIRIVLVENQATIDKTQKINQRGIYICKDRACLQKVLKNKHFLKGLNQLEKQSFALEMESILDE